MLKKNPEIRRRQQQTWQAGSMSVHGIVVSYAVQYNYLIKHLLTGYSVNNKFIGPLDTNYYLWLRLGQKFMSRRDNKLTITLKPVNKCIAYFAYCMLFMVLVCIMLRDSHTNGK